MGFFQLPVPPLSSTIDLTGKTIIVTGSTAGLGLEAARQFLVFKACTVILAVRNVPKGETARASLQADPKIKAAKPTAKIEIMKLDTASYASVIAFCDNVKRDVPRLDVLLLNAGIGLMGHEVNAETGHEKCMQVNYLSNCLLSLLLLPLLEATAAKSDTPSRLSIVGSRMHFQSSFLKNRSPSNVLEYLDDKDAYSAATHYGDTKMAVAMFLAELVKRVGSDKVIVNHMCPGMVQTGMSDVLPIGLRQIANVVKAVRGRKIEVGGAILLNAAVVAKEESHGRFLVDMEIAP
jgi:NAD(P)-dependent dehydrogenase (short-subunit alcohol dehydrogenase family)